MDRNAGLLIDGCLTIGAVAGVVACIVLTWTGNLSGASVAYAGTVAATASGLVRLGVRWINRGE